MSPSWRASLVLLVLLLPGAAAQGSHGLSDHHAFVAGVAEVPAGDFLSIQVDHVYFNWATIWYSARVQAGPPVWAFLVDQGNWERLQAGESSVPVEGTVDGPALMTGGLGSNLPRGLYFLVIQNPGAEEATVKWEVFLEPRFPGSGEPLATTTPSPGLLDALLLPLLLAGGGTAALGATWLLTRKRR